jgi:SAM-dependent methyltransferase
VPQDERLYPDPDSGMFAFHLFRYLWVLPYAFNKVVLDAGCGAGYGANVMAAVAVRVVAVDRDPAVIARNRSLYTRAANLTFTVMDLTACGLVSSQFDLVVSFEVFEHLDPDSADRYVREMWRLCRTGGSVIFSTPNRLVEAPHLRSAGIVYEHHVNSVSPAELKRALSRHFSRVILYGQRPKERPLKRALKALDVLNLRHHLLSHGTKTRWDVALSGGVPSYGPDPSQFEINRFLLRQSGTIVAVCSK